MEYAPVAITTINRVEHFKRCLNSLSNNVLAKYTDVFVSVDYPPSDKYKNGNDLIKKFLETFDKSKFKNFYIFYQEQNLGASKNSKFLVDVISKKYNSYIFSEDDNEFSANFLKYMNEGLCLFENDDSILAICGAKDDDWFHKANENVVKTKLYAAYGVGTWIKKRNLYNEKISSYLLDKTNWSLKKMKLLYKRNKTLFNIYIIGVLSKNTGLFWKNRDELSICDSIKAIYMHFTDTYCVAPVVAKSRTWGNDGSGINMPKLDIDVDDKWPLDNSLDFTYVFNKPLSFYEINYEIGSRYSNVSDVTKLSFISWLLYFLLIILFKNRTLFVKTCNLLRKIFRRI